MSTQKQLHRFIGFLLLAILLVTLTSPTYAQGGDPTPTPAPTQVAMVTFNEVWTLQNANLRVSPSTSAAVVERVDSETLLRASNTILIPGASVTLNGYTSDQWLAVTAPNGRPAYIWEGLFGHEYTDPTNLPGIRIIVQNGVPETDVNLVAAGTWAGLQYMQDHFGSTIETTTVKMFNGAISNTGEESCCMSNNASEPGVRFMVRHEAWTSRTDLQKAETAAHEMLHIWQHDIGQCLPATRPALAFWYVEGVTDNWARQAMIDRGWINEAQSDSALLMFANAETYEVAQPDWFRLWESPGNYSHFRPHNGYDWSDLAVEKLVADYGSDLWEEMCAEAVRVGGGFEGFPAIFRTVTGISTTTFYNSLPDYFASRGLPTENRLAPDVGANGCGTGSAILSRIVIRCLGVNPEANQAGFVIQPASHYGDIDEVILPTGATGRWEASTEVYFVRFSTFEWERLYTVTFVIEGTEYPITFAFHRSS